MKLTPRYTPAPPQPAGHPIRRFSQSSPAPRDKPSSGTTAVSRQAVQTAKNPPGIDPRQMHN
jgi:hypothetical protein